MEKEEKSSEFLLNFDKKIFQKSFLRAFNNNKNIQIAVEDAFKTTLSESLKELNVNFTNLMFTEFIVNTYKMGITTSYKEILNKGFYITCIRGNFRNKNKEIITGIKLNSPFISQYYNAYPFLTIKITPKLTSCKFEFTNILLSSDLFNNLLPTQNCECKELQLYLDINKNYLPLLFICPICGNLYMCSCQKPYYEKFFKNYEGYETATDYMLYKNSTYQDNICFICQNKIPPEVYSYCDISTFGRRYEPYIQAIFYTQDNMSKRKAENEIRKKVGYPLIGEKWVNETTLYKLCCIIFADYEIYREYSPEWLNKMRIDIAIPQLKLAIEYQGQQHFTPIQHFGGEEGFKKTQKRDKEKFLLCKKNKWNIIYFNFYEQLTEQEVIKKVSKYLKNNKK